MRHATWSTLILTGLLALLAAWPATAAPPRGGQRGIQSLSGRVLEVRMGDQRPVVRLALNVRAASADAPGKIPMEMAQTAAELIARAVQLERNGKTQAAVRARQTADELLRWRELEFTMPADDLPIVSVRRVPLAQVNRGNRLRLLVSAEGAVPDEVVPGRMILGRDAMQVGPKTPMRVRRLPAAPRARNTFFEVVGDVVSTNPLMVQVDDQRIQIDTPPQYWCIQQAPMLLRDVQPGQRIVARATMQGELEIGQVQRILVLFFNAVTPFAPEDDLEF